MALSLARSTDGCCAQCDGVEEIGVDEHVWRRTPFGSRYVTIIVDLTPRKKGGTARLLDMVEGRSEKAFTTWLQERGQAFRERVRVVAMDAFAFGDGVGLVEPCAHVLGEIRTYRCFLP
ncbi:MAG: transposase [Bifidobacterium longum]|nr:transposase [Bifidobacterium longum]